MPAPAPPKPGPELDALVAEHVMGIRLCRECSDGKYVFERIDLWDNAKNQPSGKHEHGDVPEFSKSYEEMGKLIEKLATGPKAWSFHINRYGKDGIDVYLSAGDCNCPHVQKYDPETGHGYEHYQSECESVESLPHAVCLVALRAFGVIPDAHCILCADDCPCTDQTCGRDCVACISTCKH